MHRRTIILSISLALIAFVSGFASAQVPTGTLAGTVTDASGALVAKATVTLTNGVRCC